ncbi:MAG: anti-sigma factor family protein [Chitinispirillaceae bacterium]
MGYTVTEHPTEEELIEYALGEQVREDVKEHVQSCHKCREYIEEMRDVKEVFQSLEDIEVSPSVTKKIFSATKDKTLHSRAMVYMQSWYKYPFLLGLLTIGAVLLFYFIVIFAL